MLLGTLLVPVGYDLKPPPVVFSEDGRPKKEPALSLGLLPLARRDVERLKNHVGLVERQIVVALPKLSTQQVKNLLEELSEPLIRQSRERSSTVLLTPPTP